MTDEEKRAQEQERQRNLASAVAKWYRAMLWDSDTAKGLSFGDIAAIADFNPNWRVPEGAVNRQGYSNLVRLKGGGFAVHPKQRPVMLGGKQKLDANKQPVMEDDPDFGKLMTVPVDQQTAILWDKFFYLTRLIGEAKVRICGPRGIPKEKEDELLAEVARLIGEALILKKIPEMPESRTRREPETKRTSI